jgi:hypothetical protein
MKLGRKPPNPALDPEFMKLVGSLYYAYEDNLAVCARLMRRHQEGATAPEMHDEALEGARRIAYVSRVWFEAIAYLVPVKSIPERTLPIGVQGALARLAYCLVALAESDPEPEALLTLDEIENLTAQYEIQDWLSRCRKSNPDFTAESS